MIKKTLEEMSVMDNFLSNALATTPEVNERFYRLLLSVLLGKELGHITVNAQRFLPGIAPDRRGIRLDVEITEENNGIITDIYDVEPHHKDHNDEYKHLPRRNRFYQAKIDSRVPKSGTGFSNLHNLYVISILDYDLFGEDYMLYTVSNQCKEVPKAEYRDGLTFLYFYTKGTKGGSQQIKNVLSYLQNSDEIHAVDEITKLLHSCVAQVKESPDSQEAVMTVGEYLDILEAEMREELSKEIREEARKELREEVREEARKELREEIREEAKEELRKEIREEVYEKTREETREELRKEIREEELATSISILQELGLSKEKAGNMLKEKYPDFSDKADELIEKYWK